MTIPRKRRYVVASARSSACSPGTAAGRPAWSPGHKTPSSFLARVVAARRGWGASLSDADVLRALDSEAGRQAPAASCPRAAGAQTPALGLVRGSGDERESDLRVRGLLRRALVAERSLRSAADAQRQGGADVTVARLLSGIVGAVSMDTAQAQEALARALFSGASAAELELARAVSGLESLVAAVETVLPPLADPSTVPSGGPASQLFAPWVDNAAAAKPAWGACHPVGNGAISDGVPGLLSPPVDGVPDPLSLWGAESPPGPTSAAAAVLTVIDSLASDCESPGWHDLEMSPTRAPSLAEPAESGAKLPADPFARAEQHRPAGAPPCGFAPDLCA